MSILHELNDMGAWRAYLAYKREKGHLSAREDAALEAFIQSEEFRALPFADPAYTLPPPQRREISKLGSAKKRVVYTFASPENDALKLMAFLLSRYDGLFANNCYAFRKSCGAADAVRRMSAAPDVESLYGCKLDIQNYFNSIDIDLLLPMLRTALTDDPALYALLARLLTADAAISDGVCMQEKRGAMAGVPVSAFLANLYLADMDRHFAELGVLYARYSDDILLFAPSPEALDEHLAYIRDMLAARRLCVNEAKVQRFAPGEAWSFLGVEYHAGRVGVSPASAQKLKGKIRRRARALYRWKLRKGATDERAVRAFLRAVNERLYGRAEGDALTWARWFFPLLTRDGELAALDDYICACARYVASGRYAKANYRLRYDTLRAWGFTSLVNAYYRYKKGEGLPPVRD